jgi:LPS export ABC transporter permease LptF
MYIILIMKIITRYTIRQFIPHFLLGLLVFTFILIMDKIFELVNLIINKGVSVVNVVMLFLYTLPSFLSLTLPMALLMGTLLTLGSMQEDNEITAIRAGGISQTKIIIPLIIISILATLCLVYFNQEIAPISQKQFSKIYYKIAYQRPALNLEENAFTEIGNYRLFIKKINRNTNTLKSIIIYDLSEENFPVLVSAQKGAFKKIGKDIILELYSGIMQKKDYTNPSRFNQIHFETYSIKLAFNQSQFSENQTKNIANLTGRELQKTIYRFKKEKIDYSTMEVQYFQRITIALACLTFVLLGCPLALMTKKHNKAIAFGLSLVLILIFYILLAMGIRLGESQTIPAIYAMALPNIILLPISFVLLFKLNKQ